MKKSIFGLVMVILFLLAGCVTKQKYQELETLYKRCGENLSLTTNEKLDAENLNKNLDQELGVLKSRVENLKNDTLSLSRRLVQSERNYNKAKHDYDALLKDFADANLSNNAETASLLEDIDTIKAQLHAREAELNSQRSALETAQAALSEKEARLAELQNILTQKDNEVKQLKEKVANALKGFENKGLKVSEKNGKVYVSMDEKLLFASGSWEIGSNGMDAIKELAKVLEFDNEINVLIEGHTDNVPFKGSGQVKDNWDLSVMRATAVVKALLKNGKIDPKRVSASGRADYFPVDMDNTSEARAKNRRTEIILTPKLDELFQIIESN
ncbi:MAG: OmpA family protein [Bacteroidales bacterium]|nr:OmpA family protein [Bacteroidales bacterium]